jgi:hypothetical protein
MNQKEVQQGQDLFLVFGWEEGRDERGRRIQSNKRRGRRSTASPPAFDRTCGAGTAHGVNRWRSLGGRLRLPHHEG